MLPFLRGLHRMHAMAAAVERARRSRPFPLRSEDERGFRPPWDDRSDGRGPPDAYSGRGFDEDRWVSGAGMRGIPPPPARPPLTRPLGSADRFGSFDRFSAGVDFPPFHEDATLFPPPPGAARPPPPPPPPRAAQTVEHDADAKSDPAADPEREAFLAELERVAQDLEKVHFFPRHSCLTMHPMLSQDLGWELLECILHSFLVASNHKSNDR
jgi:hypothetical protein